MFRKLLVVTAIVALASAKSGLIGAPLVTGYAAPALAYGAGIGYGAGLGYSANIGHGAAVNYGTGIGYSANIGHGAAIGYAAPALGYGGIARIVGHDYGSGHGYSSGLGFDGYGTTGYGAGYGEAW